MNFTESVTITVLPQESFDVDLMDDDGAVGPNHLASDISADSGQQVHLNMSVINTGNIAVDLDVSVLPDNPQWALQVRLGEVTDTRQISLQLGPGETKVVRLIFGVPVTAEEGDSNTFTIRTERSLSNFRQNITTLIVRDELSIELTPPENGRIDARISDAFSYGEFLVKNTGNTYLSLEWNHGLAPDGWSVGFANPTVYLEPREKNRRFGWSPRTDSGYGQRLRNLVTVNGSNQGRSIQASEMITVGVVESLFGNITTQREGARLLLVLIEMMVARNAGHSQRWQHPAYR